ncbi:MAG: 2-iminoacetate synthase ThiH [Spirochaetae bacterium HGW-Spirochaetae-6]|nr:MAG: 2-iminoacetate synthase ThiH [Spirochaetae bacterium HGW-Spirochaetae-6]
MFDDYLKEINFDELYSFTQAKSLPPSSLSGHKLSLRNFAFLLSRAAQPHLESLARRAHQLTVMRFGYTVNLYTPIYISNFCVNSCPYCSFNHTQPIQRKTLSLEEFTAECRILKEMGFNSLLLVSGEAPREINLKYISDCLQIAKSFFHQVALEVYPLDQPSYSTLKALGLDGVTLYQETYDRPLYETLHQTGPKSHYTYRLQTMDRAGAAGIKKLNLGFLLGLADWRREALHLAAHLQYLRKFYWQAELSASFPRIRENSAQFSPPCPVPDKELAQLIIALRLFDPGLNLVLSTRENGHLRNSMLPLGITTMSAGSKTNPGGYAGEASGTQFTISDERPPASLASYLRTQGYETVWKDWEIGI